MKQALVQSRSPRQGKSVSMRRPSAGPNGIAIAPPAYGIDFLDRQRPAALANMEAVATIQRQVREYSSIPGRQQENRTGLPDHLKAGIETLSGLSMDDVRVHYNSSEPAQLQALAYTQGTDIHVGPGQETHLPHEAWHVVQQVQGRVKPTIQAKGVGINDDAGLEHEADVMGTRATEPVQDKSRASCLNHKRVNEGERVKQLLKVPTDHVRGDLRHHDHTKLFTKGTIEAINENLSPRKIDKASNLALDEAIDKCRADENMDYNQLSQRQVSSEKQMTAFLEEAPEDEHMYVLESDKLHVAIRAETKKLPHPTLVGGDPDVACAGTIRKEQGEVVVTCSSGHFRPPTEGPGKKHVAKMMEKTAGATYKKQVKGKRR